MFKKLISICVILSMSLLRVYASEAPTLSAECAVVVNVQTGEILYSKNAEKRRSMASTTKIMTALLAIESGKLQSEIVVSEDMVNVEGTSMGLVAGDSVSLDELVYGMLLSSGNDAANTVAYFLGGGIEGFAVMMNERAAEIGMKNTNFVTPSGLDSDEHYSTAYDMALLGIEAVKNPKFVSVCSSESAALTYGNPPYRRTVTNHNKLLKSYDYALGIKTGFTKKSGRCLVSYAMNEGSELVAVTLNAPDDWNDHRKLLDYGFESVQSDTIIPQIPESLQVVGSNVDSVKITVKPFSYSYYEKHKITYKVFINKFIYAPVKADTVVGYCVYYMNGKLKAVEPILTEESVT